MHYCHNGTYDYVTAQHMIAAMAMWEWSCENDLFYVYIESQLLRVGRGLPHREKYQGALVHSALHFNKEGVIMVRVIQGNQKYSLKNK